MPLITISGGVGTGAEELRNWLLKRVASNYLMISGFRRKLTKWVFELRT